MPRLSREDWDTIRAKREAGASIFSISKEFDISHTAIRKKSIREEWGDGSDVQAAIRRKVSEKVAGVSTGNPIKKAEAIDAEAERRAAVRLRHRQECEQIAVLRQEAIKCRKAAKDELATPVERVLAVKEAFEKAKLAKILAESLAIQHQCECRSWGLDVVEYDLSKLSDEQLAQIIQGKSIR